MWRIGLSCALGALLACARSNVSDAGAVVVGRSVGADWQLAARLAVQLTPRWHEANPSATIIRFSIIDRAIRPTRLPLELIPNRAARCATCSAMATSSICVETLECRQPDFEVQVQRDEVGHRTAFVFRPLLGGYDGGTSAIVQASDLWLLTADGAPRTVLAGCYPGWHVANEMVQWKSPPDVVGEHCAPAYVDRGDGIMVPWFYVDGGEL